MASDDNDTDWEILPDEQAAAPQPPQIIPNESTTTSTSSLIDVDTQSVRTVPSDFMDQPVQTETQAARIEREEAIAKERAAIDAAAQRKAKGKAKRAEDWLSTKIASLSETQASSVVFVNLAAVVGVSTVLGYKAWGLYERGALSWKTAGIGAAIVGTVGIVESVFSRYVFFLFLVLNPTSCPTV